MQHVLRDQIPLLHGRQWAPRIDGRLSQGLNGRLPERQLRLQQVELVGVLMHLRLLRLQRAYPQVGLERVAAAQRDQIAQHAEALVALPSYHQGCCEIAGPEPFRHFGRREWTLHVTLDFKFSVNKIFLTLKMLKQMEKQKSNIRYKPIFKVRCIVQEKVRHKKYCTQSLFDKTLFKTEVINFGIKHKQTLLKLIKKLYKKCSTINNT